MGQNLTNILVSFFTSAITTLTLLKLKLKITSSHEEKRERKIYLENVLEYKKYNENENKRDYLIWLNGSVDSIRIKSKSKHDGDSFYERME